MAGLVLALAAAGSSLAVGEARGAGATKAVEQQLAARVKEQTQKAEAQYKAALKRCADAQKPARKACRDEAKITRDAAIRQARIQRVQKLAELKEKPKPPKSAGELYISEKARCEMMGFERESCLAGVKQRFNKG